MKGNYQDWISEDGLLRIIGMAATVLQMNRLHTTLGFVN